MEVRGGAALRVCTAHGGIEEISMGLRLCHGLLSHSAGGCNRDNYVYDGDVQYN